MITCPHCEMKFNEENVDDQHEHRAYHDKVLYGVSAGTLATDEVIWSGVKDWITVVTPLSPKAQRVRARKVAQLANHETHYHCGIYHEDEKPDEERHMNLFLYYRKNRIVGLAILEKRGHIWRCNWDEYVSGECRKLDIVTIWSLAFIWVLMRHRHGGVARKLFDEAIRFLKTEIENVGFYTEFTPDGEAFIRALHPRQFLIAK